MVDLRDKCKLCFGIDFVESENDIVCVTCGVVAGINESQDVIIPKYNISLTAETKLGSSNIVDSSLNLIHLNKNFTSKMLNSADAYLEYFSKSCEDLHIPKNIARNAFYLFQKLRNEKLGLGRTAVFCIVQAYTFADTLYDGALIIKTVKHRFGLKRKITISQVIYRIKPTAIEMGLINDSPDSKLLHFKKNIDSDKHYKAVKIIDSFSGNSNSQTKAVQEYLEAYDVSGGSMLCAMRSEK